MLSMKTEAEQVGAVLHDVLEDTDIGKVEVVAHFGLDIFAIVETLTRRDGEQYFDYIKRIRPHPTAKAIKIADLCDNMNPARMNAILNEDKETIMKRFKKYQKALKILKEVRKSREL